MTKKSAETLNGLHRFIHAGFIKGFARFLRKKGDATLADFAQFSAHLESSVGITLPLNLPRMHGVHYKRNTKC